jgi:hypothetical protein
MQNEQTRYTVAGTDIEEVKRRNAAYGLSYKEVMAEIARTGGRGTRNFSNTNVDEVKNQLGTH